MNRIFQSVPGGRRFFAVFRGLVYFPGLPGILWIRKDVRTDGKGRLRPVRTAAGRGIDGAGQARLPPLRMPLDGRPPAHPPSAAAVPSLRLIRPVFYERNPLDLPKRSWYNAAIGDEGEQCPVQARSTREGPAAGWKPPGRAGEIRSGAAAVNKNASRRCRMARVKG